MIIYNKFKLEDDKKLLTKFESKVNNAMGLKKQFENWYMVLPILSFNGSKYDIN